MLTTISLLFVIGMLAIISPGPDFFLILRNASLYSRKDALCTVAGITLGIVVHITYCLFGIGLLISQSIFVYNFIKYCGAAYLVYIGIKSLRSRGGTVIPQSEVSERGGNARKAFMEGLLCNMTNPKVTLLMLSVFTQVIEPGTPLYARAIYGSVFVVQTIVYWSLLVVIIQQKAVQRVLLRVEKYIDRFFGAVLLGLGLKVALSD